MIAQSLLPGVLSHICGTENKGWELVAEAKQTADENVRDLGESFLILNPEGRAVSPAN